MIKLINGYYIDAEDYGYSLCHGEPKKEKSGKIKRNIIGYYGSISAAIEACRQELVHEYVQNAENGLAEALRTIRMISNDVKEALKDIEA